MRPPPKDMEELRALRWDAAKRRIAIFDKVKDRPRRLIAWYLMQASASRGCMGRNVHPGRWWWKRQWEDRMDRVQALQARS